MATDRPNPRRFALGVVRGQVAVALAAACVSWAVGGALAGWSALLGGGIGAAASLVMAVLGFTEAAAADPYRALRAFFVGEAAKVAVVIGLFVAVLKTTKVVPLAMLGAYLATFVVFWAALARGLPGTGDLRAGRP